MMFLKYSVQHTDSPTIPKVVTTSYRLRIWCSWSIYNQHADCVPGIPEVFTTSYRLHIWCSWSIDNQCTDCVPGIPEVFSTALFKLLIWCFCSLHKNVQTLSLVFLKYSLQCRDCFPGVAPEVFTGLPDLYAQPWTWFCFRSSSTQTVENNFLLSLSIIICGITSSSSWFRCYASTDN